MKKLLSILTIISMMAQTSNFLVGCDDDKKQAALSKNKQTSTNVKEETHTHTHTHLFQLKQVLLVVLHL